MAAAARCACTTTHSLQKLVSATGCRSRHIVLQVKPAPILVLMCSMSSQDLGDET